MIQFVGFKGGSQFRLMSHKLCWNYFAFSWTRLKWSHVNMTYKEMS